MSVIRDFYNSDSFFLKSDEICIGIILKRNFELPAIFSGDTSNGYRLSLSTFKNYGGSIDKSECFLIMTR